MSLLKHAQFLNTQTIYRISENRRTLRTKSICGRDVLLAGKTTVTAHSSLPPLSSVLESMALLSQSGGEGLVYSPRDPVERALSLRMTA